MEDYGIGVTNETVKAICNVGNSYFSRKKLNNEIKEMPLWLKPTAGFGIGLQSIFLLSEQFTIISCVNGECIEVTFESRVKEGYVHVLKSEKRIIPGTEIHIKLKKSAEKLTYGLFGRTANYLDKEYDLFSLDNKTVHFKLTDTIGDNCKNTMFPINIYRENEKIETSNLVPFAFEKTELEKNCLYENYLFKYDFNEIKLWDKEHCIYFKFNLNQSPRMFNSQYKFKGMEIKFKKSPRYRGISYEMDIYGLDTKETISLNREEIRSDAGKKINEYIEEAFKIFKEIMKKNLKEIKELMSYDNADDIKDRLYSFWACLNSDEKIEVLDYGIYKEVERNIRVLKNNEEDKVEIGNVDFKDLVKNIDNVGYVNLPMWGNNSSIQEKEEIVIEKLQEKNIKIAKRFIVIDETFLEEIKKFNVKDIDNMDDHHFLYWLSQKAKGCLELNNNGIKNYLLGLLIKKNEKKELFAQARISIPAFKIYEKISTLESRFPWVEGDCFGGIDSIISPFLNSDLENMKRMSCEYFIDGIVNRDDFKRLVEYIMERQESKTKKEDIVELYKKLIKECYNLYNNIE